MPSCADSDANSNSYSHADTNSHSHSDPDSYSYSNGNCDSNTYSKPNAYTDTDAVHGQMFTHPAAAPYSGAAGLGLLLLSAVYAIPWRISTPAN